MVSGEMEEWGSADRACVAGSDPMENALPAEAVSAMRARLELDDSLRGYGFLVLICVWFGRISARSEYQRGGMLVVLVVESRSEY